MKILIADDDSVSRCMMEQMLLKAGYKVIAVQDGNEAFEQLSKTEGPRLALLDWMMPRMDGLEVCRELRRSPEKPYTYITLLTSKGAKEDLIAGLEAGADDYLTKPCNPQELKARLRAGQRILRLEDTLVKAREDMRFRATRDPLTLLLNRGAILAQLEREIDRVELGHDTTFSLLLCDVDHFKLVNDLHGHVMGDAVLKEVAARLKHAVRPNDLVGRYGGEEFLILLRDCGKQSSELRAEEVRLAMCSSPITIENKQLPIAVSMGLMTIDRSNSRLNTQSILSHVDVALYRAKMEGRNRTVLAEPLSASSSEPAQESHQILQHPLHNPRSFASAMPAKH